MTLVRSVTGFLLVSVAAWVLYLSTFVSQLGVHTVAEYWMYSAQVLKEHLLHTNAERHKVLFVGGSSAWMGIDAGLAGEILGIRAINLGLHGMMPLDQLVNEVEPVLKAGDVVILPLEYEYYVIDTRYNAWFLNQTMVGRPEWFWRLPWREKLRFVAAVPPLRVLEGTMTGLFADRLDITRKRQLEQDPEKILEAMRQAWAQGALPDSNYTFRNIDQDGDAIVARGSFATYVYPLDRAVLARNYPWKTLDAFAKTCAARHVRVYVGWPPVVKGLINFESRTARRNTQVIMQRLAEMGIPVLGHPADFAYDRSLFADSGYHLIHEGRALHTGHMLRLLQEIMGEGMTMPRHSPA